MPSRYPGHTPLSQVVREHYLRDDIYSGSPLDLECPPESHKLGAASERYLLIDTNVALHQIDFLEHASTSDVVRGASGCEGLRPHLLLIRDGARNAPTIDAVRGASGCAGSAHTCFPSGGG
eukprot:365686-Chlamydomonas_euryale.AAC.3